MLRLAIAVGLVAASGAAFAEDRFSPDNPTFGQYRESCYVENHMADECKGSALGAFAEHAGVSPDKVLCDFDAYWVAAEKLKSAVLDVLPWQSVVEQLVETPNVCAVKS